MMCLVKFACNLVSYGHLSHLSCLDSLWNFSYDWLMVSLEIQAHICHILFLWVFMWLLNCTLPKHSFWQVAHFITLLSLHLLTCILKFLISVKLVPQTLHSSNESIIQKDKKNSVALYDMTTEITLTYMNYWSNL